MGFSPPFQHPPVLAQPLDQLEHLVHHVFPALQSLGRVRSAGVPKARALPPQARLLAAD